MEVERPFSLPVRKVEPGIKKRVKTGSMVAESKTVGNTRVVKLRNGSVITIGPRPVEPYFC
jgi:hypothetical protein